MGRFTKKMARQLSPLVSSPPATGPTATATEPAAVQMAIARARLPGSEYVCRISAREAGTISAAAPPCTMRETIRVPSSGARPQAAEARVKPARPRA